MLKEIKTVHIIGFGAIGATYGSLLYDYDKSSVKMVLDEKRAKTYDKISVINGRDYYFDYVIPSPDSDKAELIILAVKGHNLTESINTITPLVGKDTIILSLLNGISSEDELSRAFGKDKVLHGFCVGTDSGREDRNVKFTNSGKIVFNEYYNEIKGKAPLVAQIFDKAKINYSMPHDIRREMWWKFMMNVGVNQTSAILRAPYGVYATVSEAQKLLASACKEVIPLAEKEGVSLYESDIDEFFKIFKTLSPFGRTSMFQDVEAGRKTEVESFALTVVNLGKKHGMATPVNETLYLMLRVLEQKQR